MSQKVNLLLDPQNSLAKETQRETVHQNISKTTTLNCSSRTTLRDLIVSMEKSLPPSLQFNLQALQQNPSFSNTLPVVEGSHPQSISSTEPTHKWLNSGEFSDLLSGLPQNLLGENLPNLNTYATLSSHSSSSMAAFSHDGSGIETGSLFADPPQEQPHQLMESFPQENLQDFKHVLYNLLVEAHNNPHKDVLVMPYTVKEHGLVRHGFRFNTRLNPEKRVPELYAQHIKKARLDWEDQSSVFIQDLYRYYMRACVELLSKYFDKRDKYTYLYDDTPLFVPNESLEMAEERIKSMRSRARKRRHSEDNKVFMTRR